jgi:GNAT superfamily N-acetyltransferase
VRALAFERAGDALAADRADEHPLGLAVHSAGNPHMWVLNQLWVVGPQPELDDRALRDELDRLFPHSTHRRAVCSDDATGARLAGGMRAVGFAVERLVVMPLAHEPAAPPPGVAREVDRETWRAVELACARDDPSHGPGLPEELLRGYEAFRRRPGTRMFVGAHDGVDACVTTLYGDGAVAQPENVTTLRAHRGHGLASATVALAAREALAAGHELVFICAEEGSGAQRVYERLGFRPAGRCWAFTRRPG